jgi:hypothetical protein
MALVQATVSTNPIVITGNIGQTVITSLSIASTNPTFNAFDFFNYKVSVDGGVTYNNVNLVSGFSGANSNTPGAVASFNYALTYTISPTPLIAKFKIIYSRFIGSETWVTSEQIIDVYTLSAFTFCLNRTGCHSWKITTPTGARFVAQLKNEYGIVLGNYTETANTITLDKDGIYTVEMSILNYTLTNTLVDFCDLFACVEAMLNFIYCKSNAPLEVSDPCYTAKNPEDCNSKLTHNQEFEWLYNLYKKTHRAVIFQITISFFTFKIWQKLNNHQTYNY